MRELRTEIQISSTPDMVWNKLMDFPSWPNWNPIVNKIEGNVEIGSELSITMSDSKGKDAKNYKSIITAIDENKRFSFNATMIAKFMFSAERIIELKESQEGTLFIQREIYAGLMVPIFWKKLSKDALLMLHSMNKALKKEVEK
ncbi:MAG: hypothetical protein COC08_08470 [Maribacter sp.]|nr:MAG: hypothetical protein COC08_08470 [Maribacter sp.]